MSVFSKIDMGEVTRLTRAGKLAEALAVLQSGNAPGDDRARSPSGEIPADVTARSGEGAVRRLSTLLVGRIPGELTQTAKTARADLSPAMRELRERLANPGLISPLGGGMGRLKTAPVPDGARFEERTFPSARGDRSYKIYVPSGYTGQSLPVVVMLHGCTQDPDDFAAGTRMNELAEEYLFLVAYPRQPTSANMQKCWNWFDAAHQQRDGGEPSLIAGVALEVVEEFCADRTRVYVAGLSAGGAAAAIMGVTHPELFAAVGVHSGLACGAASDMSSAFAAMGAGASRSPRGVGPATPTIVFHGDADRTVNHVNSDHVLAQAKASAAMTEVVTHGESPGGVAYTRTAHCDARGQEVLEQWTLHGAGHAWSGGSASGSYTDPRGPDASREMVRFFLQHANA